MEESGRTFLISLVRIQSTDQCDTECSASCSGLSSRQLPVESIPWYVEILKRSSRAKLLSPGKTESRLYKEKEAPLKGDVKTKSDLVHLPSLSPCVCPYSTIRHAFTITLS